MFPLFPLSFFSNIGTDLRATELIGSGMATGIALLATSDKDDDTKAAEMSILVLRADAGLEEPSNRSMDNLVLFIKNEFLTTTGGALTAALYLVALLRTSTHKGTA